MSLPGIESLKPASSLDLIKNAREPEDFTTAVIRHMCSMEFGGWGVGAKIINDDAFNTITYRLHSDRGRARIVPVNSDVTINEWFDIIIITPNAATGTGQLEIDVVPFKEAKRPRQQN